MTRFLNTTEPGILGIDDSRTIRGLVNEVRTKAGSDEPTGVDPQASAALAAGGTDDADAVVGRRVGKFRTKREIGCGRTYGYGEPGRS